MIAYEQWSFSIANSQDLPESIWGRSGASFARRSGASEVLRWESGNFTQ